VTEQIEEVVEDRPAVLASMIYLLVGTTIS
jgi:hypothetical protein